LDVRRHTPKFNIDIDTSNDGASKVSGSYPVLKERNYPRHAKIKPRHGKKTTHHEKNAGGRPSPGPRLMQGGLFTHFLGRVKLEELPQLLLHRF